MRRSHTVRLLAVALLTLSSPALCPGQEAARDGPEQTREELEDRLLEAELLEVSAGDLERAMSIYRSLLDAPETPESVRARALLYLARSHRKLGQIDRAKTLLERLVEQHEEERSIVRQARAFLSEIQGIQRNPAFDWLGELGKSPEIQARVFDLAMDLVDLESDAGRRARRQLLALGTLAVPVIEKMVVSSRDRSHRHHLALLLLRFGKVEAWNVLLDPASPLPTRFGRLSRRAMLDLSTYLRSLRSLSEEGRARLVKTIDALPRSDATEPYRELILLHAGVPRDLARALPQLEVFVNSPDEFEVTSVLGERIKADPSAARTLAQRILDPACAKRRDYYELLEENAPAALETTHHEAMVERLEALVRENLKRSNRPRGGLRRLSELDPLLRRLEESGRFDRLRRLAEGVLAPNVVDYFWTKYVESGAPEEAPAAWAAVLRAAKPLNFNVKAPMRAEIEERASSYTFLVRHGAFVLHLMAEANDAFVGELADFLTKLHEEAEGFEHYGARLVRPWESAPWRPSRTYVEAMRGVLAAESPLARAIALEALALSAPLSEATFERVAALASSDPHGDVRELALYALGRHVAASPGAAPRFLKPFSAEALREPTESSRLSRNLFFGSVRFDSPVRGRRSGRGREELHLPGADRLLWVLREGGRGDSIANVLYPHVVDLTTDADGRRLHAWFLQSFSSGEKKNAPDILLERALGFEDPERKEHAMLFLNFRAVEESHNDKLKSFFRRVATDRNVTTESRLEAIRRVGWATAVAWFDWPRYLRSDDALLDVLPREQVRKSEQAGPEGRFFEGLIQSFESEDEATRATLWTAAFESPHEEVRRYAYKLYPERERDLLVVLERGLGDAAAFVRLEAKLRILKASRVDVAPLLLALLKDGARDVRLGAIDALARMALKESVEPLIELLDDPDSEVRNRAFSVLKSVRETLEEKREWQVLLKELRESKARGTPPEKP